MTFLPFNESKCISGPFQPKITDINPAKRAETQSDTPSVFHTCDILSIYTISTNDRVSSYEIVTDFMISHKIGLPRINHISLRTRTTGLRFGVGLFFF